MNTVKSVNKLNCPVNAYKQANIAIKNVELVGDGKLIKNADGYAIYRWDEKKQEFKQISEVEACEFLDTSVEANTSYRYKIVAYLYVDGVRYDGKSTAEIGVATASSNYGIFATGYEGYYDGNSHHAVTLEGVKNTDTVTYSTDQKNWSAKVPTVTDVKDSGIVFVKVVREGQTKPYEITVATSVSPCLIEWTDIALKNATEEWNGQNHTPKIISQTCTLDKDYTVSGMKAYQNIGSYPITVTGIGNYTGTRELAYEIVALKGHKYTISGYIYKVTGDDTVSVTGVTNKKKTSLSVKNTIKIGGKTYKITAIDANAFKNCKKAKKAIIGKNVTTIGNKAFYKCNKLSKITIPSI